ncbi:MAG: chromate transporter [Oscillospiraceae bacterium]|jgi:chromate transporter|nr:chromate transporter [Oscillospiraceae bacterium]
MLIRELVFLFLTFAKVGVCTFGGGYAMIPLLIREIADKRGWMTREEFSDCTSVGQCTPGIIAVNIATFVGFRRRGILGGIAATLGIISPSAVIILILAAFLRTFTDIPAVARAFAGIRICVVALIVKTVVTLWKTAVPTVSAGIIFAAILTLAAAVGVTPSILAVAAAAFGACRAGFRSAAK